MERCARCQEVVKHMQRTCKVPWPAPEIQECDICHKTTDPKHEARDCPKWNADMDWCETCGHIGHRTKICDIKDKPEQFTPKRKAAYEKKLQSPTGAKTPGKAAGSKPEPSSKKKAPTPTQASSSKSAPLPMHNKSAAKLTPCPATMDEGSRRQLRNVKITKTQPLPLPKLTAKNLEKAEWAKANLDLCGFSVSGKLCTNNGDLVLANFFPIKFDPSSKASSNIRKYRIILGKLHNDKEGGSKASKSKQSNDVAKKRDRPPKRETIRALIEGLLHDQRKPDAKVWASDYLSHVVSVGKLFDDMPDNEVVGNVYSIQHFRPGHPGEGWQVVDSRLVYEGSLDKKKLENHVKAIGSREPNYLPGEDLSILNIVTWKKINVSSFRGIRVGKKFYPEEQDPRYSCNVMRKSGKGQPALPNEHTAILYHIKTGFFSSIRPGHGSLLLNVNSATSAFYATINLHDWIVARFMRGGRVTPRGVRELKGLRVTFSGDVGDMSSRKKRVIFGVSDNSAFAEAFHLKDRMVTVYDHIIRSGCFIYFLGSLANKAFLAYPSLRPFTKNTACINLGGLDPKWYPADKLTIVPGQLVCTKLDNEFTEEMVTKAQRSPKQNKDLIKDKACPLLGIDADQSLYHVDRSLKYVFTC